MIKFLLALSISLLTALMSLGAAAPVITLERTTCFGTCPAYKLTIFDDGKVLFEGKEFVKQKGKAEGQITKAQLADLVRAFNRINYMKLDNNYNGERCPDFWTDYPTAITSINQEGQLKSIVHYQGCRGLTILDQLTTLENKIDEVANTKRWIE
ncbi:MAG TPA: DUF6438 domain-containing protein [Pyrinomonadaceae bacterium]|jgi:hypothetical protein|nr:DUF6438 domain-containing protein [Pyrinomonadaceae bacterium]